MIKPEELKQYRFVLGMSQVEAAQLVYTSERTWRKWERAMPVGKADKNNYKARTELFEYKIKELSDAGN